MNGSNCETVYQLAAYRKVGSRGDGDIHHFAPERWVEMIEACDSELR